MAVTILTKQMSSRPPIDDNRKYVFSTPMKKAPHKLSAKAYMVDAAPCPRDGSTRVLMEDVGLGSYYSATCKCGEFVTNIATHPAAIESLRKQCATQGGPHVS